MCSAANKQRAFVFRVLCTKKMGMIWILYVIRVQYVAIVLAINYPRTCRRKSIISLHTCQLIRCNAARFRCRKTTIVIECTVVTTRKPSQRRSRRRCRYTIGRKSFGRFSRGQNRTLLCRTCRRATSDQHTADQSALAALRMRQTDRFITSENISPNYPISRIVQSVTGTGRRAKLALNRTRVAHSGRNWGSGSKNRCHRKCTRHLHART